MARNGDKTVGAFGPLGKEREDSPRRSWRRPECFQDPVNVRLVETLLGGVFGTRHTPKAKFEPAITLIEANDSDVSGPRWVAELKSAQMPNPKGIKTRFCSQRLCLFDH